MKKHTILKNFTECIFVILALIILLPMAWMILNSLKTNQELFRDSLALPAVPQFKNWINAWNQGLYKYFGNSLHRQWIFTYWNSYIFIFPCLWSYVLKQKEVGLYSR